MSGQTVNQLSLQVESLRQAVMRLEREVAALRRWRETLIGLVEQQRLYEMCKNQKLET